MVTIEVDQLVSNCDLYWHRCLENIKKLFRYAGKYDYQQKFKDILEASMVSTTDKFTDNGITSNGPSVSVKNPSAIKLLRQFSEFLDVKKRLLSEG